MKKTPLKRKTRIAPIGRKARENQRGLRRMAWREEVFARDQSRCRMCGRRAQHAHHILYRSQGGPDELWNGVALCWSCHERVHQGGGKTWRPRLYALTGGPPATPEGDA